MKKLIIFTLALLLASCSEDDNNEVLNNNPQLILELTGSNSYSATFNYSFSEVESLKLIWNDTSYLKTYSFKGEKEIDISNNTIVINDLESNRDYYFRLYSHKNNEVYYSEIISIHTPKVNLSFDGPLVDHLGYLIIESMKQITDGFLIGARILHPYEDSSVEIIKLDNNLNIIWNINVNESPYSNKLAELHDLQDGNYIATVGLNYTQTYAFKFNSNGSIEWIKHYNHLNKAGIASWFNSPLNYQSKPGQLKILTSVDTTYYESGGAAIREFEIDSEGNIIADKTFGNGFVPPYYNINYDNFGNKFNYGGIDIYPNDGLYTFNALLEKYDVNNNLSWSKNFGNYGADDYFDRIAFNNYKIVSIGKNGHENGFDGESKWVVQTDSDGNVEWDFKSTRKNFSYLGKDVIIDDQHNVYALFLDIYGPNSHVYNYASVMKFDDEGNKIWEFRDGEDFNTDHFIPARIFKINEEYLIIGEKEGKIWGKKFRM